MNLIGSYWAWRPTSPLLVQRGAEHVFVTCSLADKEWSHGPLSSSHLEKLTQWGGNDDEERVRVHVPPAVSNIEDKMKGEYQGALLHEVTGIENI